MADPTPAVGEQGAKRDPKVRDGASENDPGGARSCAAAPERVRGEGVATVEEAIADVRAGRLVVLTDDEEADTEGTLIIAAEKVTSEAVNFMARFGRGLICLALPEERMRELGIPPQARENATPISAPYGVMIDARKGTTTGISASDRAVTILTAVDPRCRPEDLARPGHVPPLCTKKGGVLARTGHAEASVDLARLAGLTPAGVLCEVMKDDGTMARFLDLVAFARANGLRVVTIADLVKYRVHKELLVRRFAEAKISTRHGEFRVIVYENDIDHHHHVALVLGMEGRTFDPAVPVLVRMHSECLTGDVFGSSKCDCGDQLESALRQIQEQGQGLLVYLRQEGRGIGLVNKIRAYQLQDQGRDTVQANEELGFKADLRDYGVGAQILVDIGVRKIRLMTNNPKKIVGLEGYGLEIVERVPLEVDLTDKNIQYLRTKKEKLGHLLNIKR
jgi:3,4-dihydroxy 2-butanone 4-phosphate synthase/GTP cyclohydrolase II